MPNIEVDLIEEKDNRDLVSILTKAAKEGGWKVEVTPISKIIYWFFDPKLKREDYHTHNRISATSANFLKRTGFEIILDAKGRASKFKITGKKSYFFPSEKEIEKYLIFIYLKLK